MNFPGKLWPSHSDDGSLGHLLEVIDYQAFCDIRKALGTGRNAQLLRWTVQLTVATVQVFMVSVAILMDIFLVCY